MIAEELDALQRLRRNIEKQQQILSEAAAIGSPLVGLDEGQDSGMVLVQYARLVGGVQAYVDCLNMIDLLVQNRNGEKSE